MKIIADASKISKTVRRKLIFILNVLRESSIYFTQLSIVLAKTNVGIFTKKKVFIENEPALLSVTMRERARASTSSYTLVYNFLIHLLPLKLSEILVHF